jgi:hypothetical protein
MDSGRESAQDMGPPPQVLDMEVAPATVQTALAASAGAAEQGLATLRIMAEQGHGKLVGLSSAAEAQRAVVGDPVPVQFVRLDELRGYTPSSDPSQLTRSVSPEVIYPVRVDARTVSAISVTRTEDGWVATGFGLDPTARLLREKLGPGDSIVRVLALNLFFGARGEREQMMLTPLEDYPRFGLQRGQALPAADAFGRLVEAARAHDGGPT